MINILNLDSVNYKWGDREILKDIFIQLETGKISGLLGRNGSGKSTLLNILFGNLSPSNSSFRLNGGYLKSPSRVVNLINICPQFAYIPDSFSIKKIFSDYNLKIIDFNTFFRENKISERQIFRNLSGGEKRLVEIFIVVKSNTMFTILDEPFSFLMPIHIEKIKQLILEEKNKKGFIISDHLYKEVIDIGNQIYLLKDAKTYAIANEQDLQNLGYINYI